MRKTINTMQVKALNSGFLEKYVAGDVVNVPMIPACPNCKSGSFDIELDVLGFETNIVSCYDCGFKGELVN